ncbi:hypothetical protein QYM36_004745 [Artemia franciscana]|uniref:Alpha-macroglobulin receptor-binding domain-containing protein n=2 Tax=Artemia franciscana TaxID=6661 RepID=A0AA88LGP3_ARTSF|nr:hypothetical protein QYM36_004745 [Artemia franciscana]
MKMTFDRWIFREKNVNVKSQDGASVSFLIRPKKLGYIDIKVSAKAPTAGDAELRKLLVKAEGETIYKNKAVLIDLRQRSLFNESISIEIPPYAVPGSEHIEVDAIADIMGPSSTWLTAFVARSFRQAQSYIAIEDSVIDQALEWLAANQAPNGSFPEIGKVSHSDMQGGAAKGVPLTAYALLAFLEKSNGQDNHKDTIDKAKRFLRGELPNMRDPYVIAVSAYALNLAEDSGQFDAFELLESKKNTSMEGKLYWSREIDEEAMKNPRNLLTKPVDIEMTAYALLTYIHRGLVPEALPIMKWLVSKRNSQGGFESTQDTVIGLFALAELAERIIVSNTDVNVKFEFEGTEHLVYLRKENAMVLQNFILPTTTKSVDITASGSGFAVVQVSYSYNVNITSEWPLFNLDTQLFQRANENRMQLTVCSSFVGTYGTNESNMAVLDVSVPSGFTVDEDSVPELTTYKDVKLAEMKEDGSGVLIYFDSVTQDTVCPSVTAFRTYKVSEQRKVPVVMYDYYDNSRRARVFYDPVPAKICDICDGSECKSRCQNLPGWKVEDGASVGGVDDSPTGDDGAANIHTLSLSLIVLAILNFLLR